MSSKRGFLRPLVLKALAVVCGVVGSAVLGEVFLRLLFPIRLDLFSRAALHEPSQTIRFKPDLNVSESLTTHVTGKPWPPYRIHTLQDTSRLVPSAWRKDHEHRHDVRVLTCVGDSFTFGVGLEDEETWPARLQHLLDLTVTSHDGPMWNVENWGMPSAQWRSYAATAKWRTHGDPPVHAVIVGLCDPVDWFDGDLDYFCRPPDLPRRLASFGLVQLGRRWSRLRMQGLVAKSLRRRDLQDPALIAIRRQGLRHLRDVIPPDIPVVVLPFTGDLPPESREGVVTTGVDPHVPRLTILTPDLVPPAEHAARDQQCPCGVLTIPGDGHPSPLAAVLYAARILQHLEQEGTVRRASDPPLVDVVLTLLHTTREATVHAECERYVRDLLTPERDTAVSPRPADISGD